MYVTDLAGGGQFTAGDWPPLLLFIFAVIYITAYAVRQGKKQKRARQKELEERSFE